jgi:hypothetical protein
MCLRLCQRHLMAPLTDCKLSEALLKLNVRGRLVTGMGEGDLVQSSSRILNSSL